MSTTHIGGTTKKRRPSAPRPKGLEPLDSLMGDLSKRRRKSAGLCGLAGPARVAEQAARVAVN
jgi:hypothetical protein